MATDEPSCAQVALQLTDYLERALPPAERDRFVDHIARCAPCCESLRKTLAAVRAMGELRGRPASSSAWSSGCWRCFASSATSPRRRRNADGARVVQAGVRPLSLTP